MPISVGDTCLGVISVQSTHTEGAYDADDERLLSTIAANVGVALQNVRLFNETQEALEPPDRHAPTSCASISSSPTDAAARVRRDRADTAVRAALMPTNSAVVLHVANGEHLSPTVAVGDIPRPRSSGTDAVSDLPIDPVAACSTRIVRIRSDADTFADWSRRQALRQRSACRERIRGQSSLMLPLVARERLPSGADLHVRRTARLPFTDKELAMLQDLSPTRR